MSREEQKGKLPSKRCGGDMSTDIISKVVFNICKLQKISFDTMVTSSLGHMSNNKIYVMRRSTYGDFAQFKMFTLLL